MEGPAGASGEGQGGGGGGAPPPPPENVGAMTPAIAEAMARGVTKTVFEQQRLVAQQQPRGDASEVATSREEWTELTTDQVGDPESVQDTSPQVSLWAENAYPEQRQRTFGVAQNAGRVFWMGGGFVEGGSYMARLMDNKDVRESAVWHELIPLNKALSHLDDANHFFADILKAALPEEMEPGFPRPRVEDLPRLDNLMFSVSLGEMLRLYNTYRGASGILAERHRQALIVAGQKDKMASEVTLREYAMLKAEQVNQTSAEAKLRGARTPAARKKAEKEVAQQRAAVEKALAKQAALVAYPKRDAGKKP